MPAVAGLFALHLPARPAAVDPCLRLAERQAVPRAVVGLQVLQFDTENGVKGNTVGGLHPQCVHRLAHGQPVVDDLANGLDQLLTVARADRVRPAKRIDDGLVLQDGAAVGPFEQFHRQGNVAAFIDAKHCQRIVAGLHIQAQGTYLEGDKEKRAAICIGPEHGTVGPDLVKEAAKEAVQGVGFDLLVVCGFAFDPHVSEEAKRYGKLTVLAARMNPDLAMGDELLKKTGSGNLFMVFGEPDVDIKKQKDGQLTVKLKGLDVYDPTTGEIRSHSTDDIACWFIDTDYNGESFFVRHAYFTGNDEPYEKLKKALRAEVDETAWSALYKTESQPFDQPTKGKIAVKVINHYGDEVLKVFDLVKKN